MPTPHTVRDFDDELLDHTPRRGGLPFLDPVLLLTELGRGGMAAVHLGYHANLHDWVAVKIRRPVDRRDAERFQAEARKLSALRTAGFVQVLDVRPTRGLFYIVMEFVNGEDLRKRWARRAKAKRPIGVAEAVALIQAAAQAVAAAHRQGVVHRDLKPENIMIAATGDLRVADLGIARGGGGDTGMTMERSIMGTPGYMAPELFKSARNATPASDVFALAVTLAYLLTGRSLLVPDDFEDLGAAEAKARAFPDLMPMVAGLPPALAQLLRDATHPEPDERVADAEQFLARLRPIAAALPTVSLADPDACRFSPEGLGELRVRAGRALADEGQMVTPGPSPTPGPTPTPSGTLPATVPERLRWPRLAGAILALAAIGVVGAVWAGGKSPELRLRVDGVAVATDRPIDVREDSTVTLEAECTEAGLFCRWERVRGREVPVAAGSQIALRLPALADADSITLAAVVDVVDGPLLRREVTLAIGANDDPPDLAELVIAEVGGDPREVVLQATDDGQQLTYELTSEQPAGLTIESVGAGSFRLVRGNVPPEGAVIRVTARAVDSRQQSVVRTADVRVLGLPASPPVSPGVAEPACQIAVLREVVLEPGEGTTLTIAVVPEDADVEPSVGHSRVQVTRVAGGYRVAVDKEVPPGEVSIRWIARRQGYRESHAETVVRVDAKVIPPEAPVPAPTDFRITVAEELQVHQGESIDLTVQIEPAGGALELEATEASRGIALTQGLDGRYRLTVGKGVAPGRKPLRWLARSQGRRDGEASTELTVLPAAAPVPAPAPAPLIVPSAGTFYLDVDGYDGSEVELAAFLAAGTGEQIGTDKDVAGLVLELRVVFENRRAVLKGRVCDAAGNELVKARSLGMVGDGTQDDRETAVVAPWRNLKHSVTAKRLAAPQKWKELKSLLAEALAKAAKSR